MDPAYRGNMFIATVVACSVSGWRRDVACCWITESSTCRVRSLPLKWWIVESVSTTVAKLHATRCFTSAPHLYDITAFRLNTIT